jgi:hypothetical protein
MTRSRAAGPDGRCGEAAARGESVSCSDAFGAALFKVEEIQ